MSLDSYKPPPGLDAAECATSLIWKFIRDAHEEAKTEKSQFKYVKTVATLAIRAWQGAFLHASPSSENWAQLEALSPPSQALSSTDRHSSGSFSIEQRDLMLILRTCGCRR